MAEGVLYAVLVSVFLGRINVKNDYRRMDGRTPA